MMRFRTALPRQALLRVCCLAAAFVAVAGCQHRENKSSVVTIRVADWGGASGDANYIRTNREIIEEFERTHPNIKVQMEHNPDAYVQKILMSVVAGTQPDVMALDASSAAIFIENNTLLDLMPFIRNDPEINLDDYYPNVLNIARRGEALYALPDTFTPMVMYYNKRCFERAGVPLPKDNWTWTDFLRAARGLTIRSSDGKAAQYGAEVTTWMPGWVMWIWQNGGDVLSPDGTRATGYLDSPQSIEAIRFYTDLVLKHKVAPTVTEAQAMGADNLLAGRVATSVSGHWSIIHFRASEGSIKGYRFRDLGVVGLPRRKKRITVIYEAGPAVMKGTRHPREAYEYAKFISGRWAQRKIAELSVGISARRDVAEEFRHKSPLDPAFLDNIRYARGPQGAFTEQYALVEDIGREAIEEILLGKSSVEEALRTAARRIDTQLEAR